LADEELKKGVLYKIPEEHRQVYKTLGGAAHLDQNYTVFGEVVNGIEVIDSIARVKTDTLDRPVNDVRIISAKLIKRKNY
jgi:peptidyl-prolyl cis-trans isomerase B (cyclophilin B)